MTYLSRGGIHSSPPSTNASNGYKPDRRQHLTVRMVGRGFRARKVHVRVPSWLLVRAGMAKWAMPRVQGKLSIEGE